MIDRRRPATGRSWAPTRDGAPGGRRRWRSAAIVAGLAITAPFGPAEAQELHGFFNSSLNVVTSESSGDEAGTSRSEFETISESADINWNKVVSPFISYRLMLRGDHSDSSLAVKGSRTRESTATLFQPAIDLTLTTPGLSLNAGGRIRELLTDGNQEDPRQLSDRNLFARLFYTPEALPSVTLQVDKLWSYDDSDPRTRDIVDTRYLAGIQYTWQDLAANYTFTHHVAEDTVAERTQTTDNHVATLSYTRGFLDGRLRFQGSVSGNYSRSVQEFNVPAEARVERRLATGLRAGVDLTPADSFDVPVVSEPALAAGTANVPLETSTAIGFELPTPPQSVAEIRIAVAADPPFSLPDNLGQFLAFEVFVSDDPSRVTWTPLGATGHFYDKDERRFVLTIPASSTRFFKIYVTRNDFGALVRATGVVAADLESVRAGAELEESLKSGSVNVGLTFSPTPWLTAAYTGSFNVSQQEPEGVESQTGTHSVTVAVHPHALLTVTGTTQYSYSTSNQAEAEDATANLYSLTFSSSPLPTLTSALSFARNESRLGGELETRTDSASLTTAARLLPGLNLDSTYSIAKSEDFVQDRETLGHTVTLSMNAQWSPRVNTVGTYTFQRARTTPTPPEGRPIATTHAIAVGTTYTLSRFVNINTRLDYTTTDDGTALGQLFRIDLIPTPKTSLLLTYRRAESDQGGVDTSSDAVAVNVRWNISRYLDLSADYAFSENTTGDRVQKVQAFNVFAGFRF